MNHDQRFFFLVKHSETQWIHRFGGVLGALEKIVSQSQPVHVPSCLAAFRRTLKPKMTFEQNGFEAPREGWAQQKMESMHPTMRHVTCVIYDM